MVTRRDMGVSFAPGEARRRVAAPQARAGPLASAPPGAPAVPGRRTEDLPLLALPACWSTLETKPWPRFFGHWGGCGNRRRGGRSWLRSLQALARPVVRSTRICLHWRGPRAPHGTVAKPLRAAPPPCADWLSTRPGAASFCLAFRLFPSLTLQAAAARRRCCVSSQRAGERANHGNEGHRPGAFEARRLHIGRLREVLRVCARTARATTRRRPAERYARWHDKMHGNVQRVGGHHGRDSNQTNAPMPITADALTGPKYRLSNDAGLVTLSRNSSPGSRRRHCCQDGSGRPSGQQAARRPKARRRCGRCRPRCTLPAARRRPHA
ncbi:Uncharacterised protein [Klebsiella pneumoniae]|uniref:Uncharacterized protein n=1 Tax=Klebsiella pneumoniae TaxID=573 RepID=A0A378A3C6_KLEPN|nr:Uncharacterised protein [Klebsiella pneumoniae]